MQLRAVKLYREPKYRLPTEKAIMADSAIIARPKYMEIGMKATKKADRSATLLGKYWRASRHEINLQQGEDNRN